MQRFVIYYHIWDIIYIYDKIPIPTRHAILYSGTAIESDSH